MEMDNMKCDERIKYIIEKVPSDILGYLNSAWEMLREDYWNNLLDDEFRNEHEIGDHDEEDLMYYLSLFTQQPFDYPNFSK